MSTEEEDTEQKLYVCPQCGKQYPKHESYAAHMKTHNKGLSKEDLVEAIKSAVSEVLSKQAETIPLVPASSAMPPATVTIPTNTQGAKIGEFIFKRRPNMDAEDIYCPNCGYTQIARPLPVVEKERPVEKEVEVIPKGYMPVPKGGEDWLKILDMKHIDGKPIDECPECSKTLLSWFNAHRSKLERASRGQQ